MLMREYFPKGICSMKVVGGSPQTPSATGIKQHRYDGKESQLHPQRTDWEMFTRI